MGLIGPAVGQFVEAVMPQMERFGVKKAVIDNCQQETRMRK